VYTIEHQTVQTIFPHFPQTVIIAALLSTGEGNVGMQKFGSMNWPPKTGRAPQLHNKIILVGGTYQVNVVPSSNPTILS